MSEKTRSVQFVLSSDVVSKSGAALKVFTYKLSQDGVQVLTTSSEGLFDAPPTQRAVAQPKKQQTSV